MRSESQIREMLDAWNEALDSTLSTVDYTRAILTARIEELEWVLNERNI